MAVEAGFQARSQPPSQRFKALIERVVRCDHPEGGDACGHGDRVARERSCLVNGPVWGELGHDLHSAAKRRDRQTAPDHLAKRRQVGPDAFACLSATASHAKTGHHFVENQHHAVLSAELAKLEQIPGPWQDQPHISGIRLDDQRRDRPRIRFERLFDGRDVVKRQHDRIGSDTFGDAWRVGHTRS